MNSGGDLDNRTELEVSSYATFVASSYNTVLGNLKSMLSVVNTTGSTVVFYLHDIRIINTQTAAVTGVVTDFRLRRCTSHSGGTLLTSLPFDTDDTISSSITVRTGATITGESTDSMQRWLWSSDEWGPGTLDVESNDHPHQTLKPAFSSGLLYKPITLRANQGLTIKCETNTTAGSFDIEIIFTQR